MECPFPIDINDNEDRDDPEIDVDQAMMHEDKKNKIEAIDDFSVTQQKQPASEFDANNLKK